MSQQILPAQKSLTPKFIGLIVLLLVIGGVVYAGLWFLNYKNKEVVVPTFTPRVIDKTAGWQTYRNEQYGFEFKYPDNFKVVKAIGGGEYLPLVHIIPTRISNMKEFVIVAGKDEMSMSIADRFLSEEKIKRESGVINPKYDEINIENSNGYVSSLLTGYEGYFREFLIALGGKTIVGHASGQQLQELEKILSTFKLIEPIVCIQIITPARNKITGEIRNFPTTCDVPEGWEKI